MNMQSSLCSASARCATLPFSRKILSSRNFHFHFEPNRPRRLAASSHRIVCSYGGGDPRSRGEQRVRRDPQRGRPVGRSPPSRQKVEITVREYAVPAIVMVGAAALLGPILGAMVFASIGFTMAIAAAVAAFSLSWFLVPLMAGFFLGIPLLFGGGLAGVFVGAGALLFFPTFIKLGLVGAAIWLGASIAQNLWFSSQPNDGGYSSFYDQESRGDVDPRNVIIDVDAASASGDSIVDEMEEEARQRQQELREFDEMLRRREQFRRGG